MMIRGTKSALSIAILLAVAGCDTADSTGDGDGGGGSTTATGSVEFSQLNFEGDVKFIGPRLHMLVSEVYRNLEYIHLTVPTTIQDKMAAASGPPIDDLHFVFFPDLTAVAPNAPGNPPGLEDCGDNAGVTTKFIDNGAVGFDAGDQILRDFDNVGCDYDFYDNSGNAIVSGTERPAYWPDQVTGSILYTFTSATGNSFQGTATFGDTDPLANLNFDISGGLLDADNTNSESYNGTVTFDIDFDTGNFTMSNIAVNLNNGTASLTAPATLTVTTVARQVNVGGRDIVTFTGGSIVSQISGQEITFSTQPFNNAANELSGLTNDNPDQGAIVFEGANNTAVRVRTDFGGGSGIVELDLDGDDAFDDAQQAEPNGWAWFVRGFLMRERAPALQ